MNVSVECGKRRGMRVRGARRLARALRDRLVASDGVVLLWALLTVIVLTTLSVGAVLSVTQNVWSFGVDNSSTSALDIAEAGLNSAISTIEAGSADATSASSSGTLNGGTWSYTASRTQNAPNDTTAYTWTITSTGSIDGETHVVETKLAETVTATTTTTTVPASPSYGYGVFLGSPTSDCTNSSSTTPPNTLVGGGTVTTSVYVAGSLCLSGGGNNADDIGEPTGSTGGTVSLYVGNKFESSGEASPVGLSTLKIKQATVVSGCIDGNHAVGVSCGPGGDPKVNPHSSGYGSGIYADGYSSTQASIPMPTIDTTWATRAKPGPSFPCNNDPDDPTQVSTFPSGWTATTFMTNVIDNTGTVNLLELGSFDCRYYDSSGTLDGRIAWSSATNTLIIDGTIWLDGSLSLQSTDYAVYQGVGTLYVDGTVSMSGSAEICAQPTSGSPCNGNYNSAQNLLELVAVNPGNASPAWTMAGQSLFEGVAFMHGAFNNTGGGAVNGEVIADTANFDGGSGFAPAVIPPVGSPGAPTTMTHTGADQATWAPLPGSWEQLS